MIRLPLWCAFGVPAFFAVFTPLYAATPDVTAPNFFGTMALHVTQTPYDSKWRYAGISSSGPISRAARPALRDLATVQQDINHRVSYRADSPLLGAGDAWSTAAETLARGFGDCEDYAIAKGQALLALGFLPQDLYLVIGNDLALRSAHAILVVHASAKFWVLDNLSNHVVNADQFDNFSPVITLSVDRKWVHGYERGARQRLVNVRAQSLDLPTDRISAIKIAQSTIPSARPPTL